MSHSKRKICYVTGTRADFGLMQGTLSRIHLHESLELALIVTGMHLSSRFGHTVDDIVAAGLPVTATVEVDLSSTSGAGMARNIGTMIKGFTDAFETIKPDVVLLLGDRGEMLAGAIAAIHLNIPVAHIHGGERSGTVDEPVRHSISKLSHLHFVATEDSRERLTKMGEHPSHIFVTGAPGLDGLEELASLGPDALYGPLGLDASENTALFVFHPVLQEAARAGDDTRRILNALLDEGLQVIALAPNSDAGSEAVRHQLDAAASHPKMRVVTHLPRAQFVSWMAICDVMVGNSSSGIIEAATFGTPVINIGIRQNLRQRNLNVIDVPADTETVRQCVRGVLGRGRFPRQNCYGDGRAAELIVSHLAELPLGGELLLKFNTY